ncbi:MAG: hypothetical protein IPK53_11475 [bacterium]|nr:hypothetical protein [bacterium]
MARNSPVATNFPELKVLTENKGGKFMTELSQHLQKLAEIAWQGGLRGKTLKKFADDRA